MVAKHYYRNAEGDLEEQDHVDRMGWEVKEAAEEGASPITTIIVDDPDSSLDYVGHRRWLITEPESESDDNVIFSGYTGTQTIAHKAGEHHNPLDRVWSIELVDVNTLWGRKVMTGSDCNRLAENDVERMQWLLQTNEADLWFENVTDYVATGSPVDMDAVDYRGQYFSQIADDCAQQSGKNWFARYMFNPDTDDHELTAFYGAYTYDSPLSLSNAPVDLDPAAIEDGTAMTYMIADDTSLARSPERVYSHVYLPYEGGAVYQAKTSTATAFALGGRDFIAPSLNVKTATKAKARATRYLNDLDTQDERITTATLVPASKGTMLRAGMMVSFRATHLPGYESGRLMRILNATPAPRNGGGKYWVGLELQGPGTAAPSPCGSVGTSTELDGTYEYSPEGGVGPSSPAWDPADPNTLLPNTSWVDVGGSDYPSAGSPTWYGVDVDRGPGAVSVAFIEMSYQQIAWTGNATYGPSLWASDDGSSWTQLYTIAEAWALHGSPSTDRIHYTIPAEWRTARYFRFRTDDLFTSGFWNGSRYSEFFYAECIP